MGWMELILPVMHKRPAALSTAHLLCQVNVSLKGEGMLFFPKVTNIKRCRYDYKRKKQHCLCSTTGSLQPLSRARLYYNAKGWLRSNTLFTWPFLRQLGAEGTAILSVPGWFCWCTGVWCLWCCCSSLSGNTLWQWIFPSNRACLL